VPLEGRNLHIMLKLPKNEFGAICRHAEAAYPLECCGVLLGTREIRSRVVRRAVPCANTRVDSPQSHYDIDPVELIRIRRGAREAGLEIVGFYHSHPDHPPRWSETDLRDAHWIGYSYLITSVENGKVAATSSFVLKGTTEDDKAFADEEIVVA
jgi:proteasome lid subunit RPN8/RPN11